jgi:flagellar biosynthetic protein FlhB
MRQLANKRMLAAVPEADLVVMNPTHYAVALKYDEATMAAPKVVAKGTDLLALRSATWPPSTRCRCLRRRRWRVRCTPTPRSTRKCPVLFAAVAQVLAWVYQLRRPPPLQCRHAAGAAAAGAARARPPERPAVPRGRRRGRA